jgi:hypothetical protein
MQDRVTEEVNMAKKELGAINADDALKELATHYPSTTPQSQRLVESAPQPANAPTCKPEAEHPLTVRIPMSVATELRMAHAQTGKSQRLIVLEALKAWGIPVADEELVERRRGPSSRS